MPTEGRQQSVWAVGVGILGCGSQNQLSRCPAWGGKWCPSLPYRTQVLSGNGVICTLNSADIRREYMLQKLEQIKCNVVSLFLISRRPSSNRRPKKASDPFTYPTLSHLHHSSPLKTWTDVYSMRQSQDTFPLHNFPHLFYGQRT